MKQCFLLFTMLIVGCCPKPVMQVRTDTLKVYQPATNDTLYLVQNDPVWTAGNDRYDIRIDTVLKKIYVHGKPDTLKVPYADSILVYRDNPNAEKSFFDGLTLKQILIWISCIGVIAFLYRMFTGK